MSSTSSNNNNITSLLTQTPFLDEFETMRTSGLVSHMKSRHWFGNNDSHHAFRLWNDPKINFFKNYILKNVQFSNKDFSRLAYKINKPAHENCMDTMFELGFSASPERLEKEMKDKNRDQIIAPMIKIRCWSRLLMKFLESDYVNYALRRFTTELCIKRPHLIRPENLISWTSFKLSDEKDAMNLQTFFIKSLIQNGFDVNFIVNFLTSWGSFDQVDLLWKESLFMTNYTHDAFIFLMSLFRHMTMLNPSKRFADVFLLNLVADGRSKEFCEVIHDRRFALRLDVLPYFVNVISEKEKSDSIVLLDGKQIKKSQNDHCLISYDYFMIRSVFQHRDVFFPQDIIASIINSGRFEKQWLIPRLQDELMKSLKANMMDYAKMLLSKTVFGLYILQDKQYLTGLILHLRTEPDEKVNQLKIIDIFESLTSNHFVRKYFKPENILPSILDVPELFFVVMVISMWYHESLGSHVLKDMDRLFRIKQIINNNRNDWFLMMEKNASLCSDAWMSRIITIISDNSIITNGPAEVIVFGSNSNLSEFREFVVNTMVNTKSWRILRLFVKYTLSLLYIIETKTFMQLIFNRITELPQTEILYYTNEIYEFKKFLSKPEPIVIDDDDDNHIQNTNPAKNNSTIQNKRKRDSDDEEEKERNKQHSKKQKQIESESESEFESYTHDIDDDEQSESESDYESESDDEEKHKITTKKQNRGKKITTTSTQFVYTSKKSRKVAPKRKHMKK